jgi:hypothetical protein
VRRLLALPLLFEGVLTVGWIATLLPTVRVYDAPVLAMVALRGVIGASQLAGGWLLLSDRPPGAAISRAAVAASSALFVAEIGLRLSPSNVDPGLRWPIVLAYSAYAALMIWLLTRVRGTQ